VRKVTKQNERIFRFAMRDRDARELYRSHGVDPAEVILGDPRLAQALPREAAPADAS
jgi:hypothetical protein